MGCVWQKSGADFTCRKMFDCKALKINKLGVGV